LELNSKPELEAFFQKCPYPFLNITVIYNQGIARITYENHMLNLEQKGWGCQEWGMFFKNAVGEQRKKSGKIDFRN
jgi:hypothetical protein